MKQDDGDDLRNKQSNEGNFCNNKIMKKGSDLEVGTHVKIVLEFLYSFSKSTAGTKRPLFIFFRFGNINSSGNFENKSI